MTDTRSTWDEVRRIGDELELKMHLASMDARDRWAELKPQLHELEQTLAKAGERAGEVLSKELAALGKALKKLRDDIVHAASPRTP